MEFDRLSSAKPTPSEEVAGRELGGFDFHLLRRNAALAATSHLSLPKAMSTGTTICGVAFDGGIVLGADTRATEGTVISDKNCEKIHYLAPNIYCCGAGTAADTESITRLIASELELLRFQTGRPSRVVTAMTLLKRRLFQYQGQISAALVLGGVDVTGPHLYTIYPHGSTDKLPFVTMGSGSLAAMAMMETGYKDGLDEAAATALVAQSVRAGIFNDLGSGSNVDLTILRVPVPPADKVVAVIKRNFQTLNDVAELRDRVVRPVSRLIPRKATVVIAETVEITAGPGRMARPGLVRAPPQGAATAPAAAARAPGGAAAGVAAMDLA